MWRLIEYLFALGAQKFWGDVQITFKEGRILHVRTSAQHTEDTLPRLHAKERPNLDADSRLLLDMMERPHEVIAARPIRPNISPTWAK